MFTTSDTDLGADLDPDHRLLLRLVCFCGDIRIKASTCLRPCIRLRFGGSETLDDQVV